MEIDLGLPPPHSSVLGIILVLLAKESSPELSDAKTFTDVTHSRPSDYLAQSIRARNDAVIDVVRNVSRTDGYFAGWSCLSKICSNVALPSALVDDVLTSIQIYHTIQPDLLASRYVFNDLRMQITLLPLRDSIYHIAPKNLGGKAWAFSEEYLSTQRVWSDTGFEPLSPCVSFSWLGVQRKIISQDDLNDCDTMTLLGAVDFDMDPSRGQRFNAGFASAIQIAMGHAAAVGTPMQGAALAALLNYDLQQYVRPIQEDWVKAARGASNYGPNAISAEDWVATLIADSTAICPFGYEDPTLYTRSKVGAFVALLLCNTHDLIYDLATSNLMSSVMYASAAGVVEEDMHCIFVASFFDAAARRLSTSSGVEPILFGENTLFVMGAWAGFSERYRTWERFVKYNRQIARSACLQSRRIAHNATQQLVLADCNSLDIAAAWRELTTSMNRKTRPRQTIVYIPNAAAEMAEGMHPDLCAVCAQLFQDAINACTCDEIRAVDGIPESVFQCRAVARAAAIRRAAIVATQDSCCDLCACRIGVWADSTSHRVLAALMTDEATTSSVEWLLRGYAVWTVMTSPISVATILSGFDLLCAVSQDEGAMGVRDVLDC
ncbi:hypothetical protein C8R43DRAFT_580203 [Mycena crocata]|nr:hypothetical protein C8R43DRAFT_580203 [Mycena crocata]